MRERALKTVLDELRAKKRKETETAERKRLSALSIPKISEAHANYTRAIFDSLQTVGTTYSPKAEEAKRAYETALSEYGFDEADFEPRISCALCGDTGFQNGKLCACVKQRYLEELAVVCDIDARAPFSFDDCDPKLAEDAIQRARLEGVYARMRKYVALYPNVNRVTIVFSGNPGTGKTCLASAMARAMVARGLDAFMTTAYSFNGLILKAHISPAVERDGILADALGCDMLIIDDLGTEPRIRNVTLEYLHMILAERQSKRLCTVITTNLASNEIKDFYDERIYSRICDKRNALFITFEGKDLRMS